MEATMRVLLSITILFSLASASKREKQPGQKNQTNDKNKKKKSPKKRRPKKKSSDVTPITDPQQCLMRQCSSDEYTVVRNEDQAGLLHALGMMEKASDKVMADEIVPMEVMGLVVAASKAEFSWVQLEEPPNMVNKREWKQLKGEAQAMMEELDWDKISTEYTYQDPYEKYYVDDEEVPTVGRRQLHDGRVLDAATSRELVSADCVQNIAFLSLSVLQLIFVTFGVLRSAASKVSQNALQRAHGQIRTLMLKNGATISEVVKAQRAYDRAYHASRLAGGLFKAISVSNIRESLERELDWFDYIQVALGVVVGVAAMLSSGGLSVVFKVINQVIEILAIIEFSALVQETCPLTEGSSCLGSERVCEFNLRLRAGNADGDGFARVRVRNRSGGSTAVTKTVGPYGTYRFEGIEYCVDVDTACLDALDLQINVLESTVEMRRWTVYDKFGNERENQGCFENDSCGGNTLLGECGGRESGGLILDRHMIYSTRNRDGASCSGNPNFKLCDQTLRLRARSLLNGANSLSAVEINPALINNEEVLIYDDGPRSGTIIRDFGSYDHDLKFCLRRGVPCDSVSLGTVRLAPGHKIEVRALHWIQNSNGGIFHSKECFNTLTETDSCSGGTLLSECESDESGGIVISGGDFYHPGEGYCMREFSFL